MLATDTDALGVHHAHLDHLGTIRLWTLPVAGDPPQPSIFTRHDYTAFGEEVAEPMIQGLETLQYTGHERDLARSEGCPADTLPVEEVNNTTLSAGDTKVGCVEVTSSNTTVDSIAEVRFVAGEVVSLGEGFNVADGAAFVAEIDGSVDSGLQDLDYMHARYCSPVTGRFLSVDPVASAKATVPQSWNKYVYGLNNPLKFVDPDGEAVVVSFEENAAKRAAIREALTFPGPRGGTIAAAADFVLSDFLPANMAELETALAGQILGFARIPGAGKLAAGGEAILESSRRIVKGKTQRGLQKLQRRIGSRTAEFQGLSQTQEQAEALISEILESNPLKAVDKQGRKILFDPNTGRAIRLTKDGEFDTFFGQSEFVRPPQ